MSLKHFFFGSFSTDAMSDAKLELADAERRLLETRSVLEDYTASQVALEQRIRRLRAVVSTKDPMSQADNPGKLDPIQIDGRDSH